MVARTLINAVAGLAVRASVKRSGQNAHLQALGQLGITKPHVWKGRNTMLDIDANLHMNNSSFVYCAELARWHLSGQNGLLDLVWKHKLVFLVGSQHFLYRAPVPAFAKYEIHTQLDAIDNKWMFMRQTFCRPKSSSKEGKVYAEATIKAIISKTDGTKVSPATLIELLGIPTAAAEALKDPAHLERYRAYGMLDDHTHAAAKDFAANTLGVQPKK